MIETIVAISTPPGRGGVGIVRLSGPQSLSLAVLLTQNSRFIPRQAVLCNIFNPVTAEVIDQGLVIYFQNPHSFTGEDLVEFQCHGSPIVLDQLVKICIENGARLANPGEFSERAFLNDKIDLTQAEAIADLIQAHSLTAARLALKSLQGDFSKTIHEFNKKLIQLRLYVEAAIDFPEEEIDFLNDGVITSQLKNLIQDLEQIRTNAHQGSMISEGLTIVIAGKTNAGKSTLINCLSCQDLAIVTDLPGTTRDVLRANILLDDLPVHIIDTAGLRETTDVIEQEGIKRAYKEISQADCILLVIDVCEPQPAIIYDEMLDKVPKDIPVIFVYNKIDQNPDFIVPENAICISAKHAIGIEKLKSTIKSCVGYRPTEGLFLARRRHLDALDKASHWLHHGQKQLDCHRAGELLTEDLRLAHNELCAITGEFTSDDLLGEIFSSFCIGK